MDHDRCDQCENPRADYDFESFQDVVKCHRCGYREWWDPQYDECGRRIWSLEIRNGAGALGYRFRGRPGFISRCLQTKAQVLRAERWLRNRLVDGSVEAQTAYLTRWNNETNQAELVIGSFRQF
jgi:hypothetical protein